MSATIINFPEPTIRPDVAKCVATVEKANHDPNLLFVAAKAGLALAENTRRDRPQDPSARQLVVNGFAISLLALAELLGVTDQVETRLY